MQPWKIEEDPFKLAIPPPLAAALLLIVQLVIIEEELEQISSPSEVDVDDIKYHTFQGQHGEMYMIPRYLEDALDEALYKTDAKPLFKVEGTHSDVGVFLSLWMESKRFKIDGNTIKMVKKNGEKTSWSYGITIL